MDIEEHLVSLVEAATDRFGRLFRYDDDFSTFWIESQIGHTRGRRVTKTVQTLYDRVWRALDAQFPERQVDWPTWPAPRALAHGQDPFLDLTRAKPLTQSSVEAMFPSQVIQQAARGDSKSLFEAIFRSPPLNYDMTWSRRWEPKGLKTTEDRFDYAEQTAKYHQVRERQLRSHLSGISWNGGATRQGLDIAAVLAGTWAYATLQEADQREVDRLAALGHSVVSDESSGLAVSVNSDFVQGPGQLLSKLTENVGDRDQQWALRGIFAKFSLKVPPEWQINSLVLGSAHINNVVASSRGGANHAVGERAWRLLRLFASSMFPTA